MAHCKPGQRGVGYAVSAHQPVDKANQAAHACDEIPDAAFVVITSHDDEELSEVS
ncbi:hypothetical protein [Pseudoduganella albidiflava]|uniref:hypothetical protein n=1 Tax=Pseudoduganella albidiflava TaxID=321983 RepID=UPI0013F157F6|nr:hypothetical protein [Pseudoduganella albidiflava]